jgi:hypothetical protein
MSSGHDCRFYEKTAGKWYYDLETYHRGEYETYGPFGTFDAANQDLNRNHSNPGGYSVTALPGCKHDLLRPIEHRTSGEFTHNCLRCGDHIDQRTDAARNTEAWQNILLRDTHNLILSTLAEKGLSKAQAKELEERGVPKENIDKALAEAAFWWKGVGTRLNWKEASTKVVAALKKILTDTTLTPVPCKTASYLTFKYRAPYYDRPDPQRDEVMKIRREFAVDIDWFGESLTVRAR